MAAMLIAAAQRARAKAEQEQVSTIPPLIHGCADFCGAKAEALQAEKDSTAAGSAADLEAQSQAAEVAEAAAAKEKEEAEQAAKEAEEAEAALEAAKASGDEAATAAAEAKAVEARAKAEQEAVSTAPRCYSWLVVVVHLIWLCLLTLNCVLQAEADAAESNAALEEAARKKAEEEAINTQAEAKDCAARQARQNGPALEDLEEIGLLGAGTFGSVSLVKYSGKFQALKALSKAHIVDTENEDSVMREKEVAGPAVAAVVCDVRRAGDGEAYALVVYDIDSNLQDLYESVFSDACMSRR